MQSGRTRSRFVAAPLLAAALAWCWSPSFSADDHGPQIADTSGTLAATDTNAAGPDDFATVKQITISFSKGKFELSKDHKAQLQALAAQAIGVKDYMISVAAYAAAAGPEAATQRLSMERARAVTAILQQHGVPLANMIVPAVTTIGDQAAPNSTPKGQAQNRAVVTLLQPRETTE
jgi:outer membrane protein OmpA-like peptidoglycan-associated protein